MRELMAHSVEVWESDPQAFSYHSVGYMQISPPVMQQDVAGIYAEQKAIGYESELIENADCDVYMKKFFSDWRAKGVTSILHEKRGGFANNIASMEGLAKKATDVGAQIFSNVTVTGFDKDNSGAIKTVCTTQGNINCSQIVIAVGPWIKSLWDMLALPDSTPFKGDEVPMWRYWALEEGVLGVSPDFLKCDDGTHAAGHSH